MSGGLTFPLGDTGGLTTLLGAIDALKSFLESLVRLMFSFGSSGGLTFPWRSPSGFMIFLAGSVRKRFLLGESRRFAGLLFGDCCEMEGIRISGSSSGWLKGAPSPSVFCDSFSVVGAVSCISVGKRQIPQVSLLQFVLARW